MSAGWMGGNPSPTQNPTNEYRVPVESQLEEVGEGGRIGAGFRGSREAGSPHPHLQLWIGEHVPIPVRCRPRCRRNDEHPVHEFVLKWGDAASTRPSAPSYQQQHNPTIQATKSDPVQQPRWELEQTE